MSRRPDRLAVPAVQRYSGRDEAAPAHAPPEFCGRARPHRPEPQGRAVRVRRHPVAVVAAYRDLNPQGLMPALEIDGRVVAQSMAIGETPGLAEACVAYSRR